MSGRRAALLVWTLFFLAGSALLCAETKPAAPAPKARPVLDSKNPTPVPIPVEFLDLKTCYELALLRMETVGLSEEDIRVAQARYWQAVGAILPTVKAVGEEAIYGDRAASFGVNNSALANDFNNQQQTARITVKQPIFSGLRDIELAKAAKAQIEGSRLTARRVRQNLYLDVAESFYQILNYEADLQVLEDIVKTLEERVGDQQKRVKLGKSRDSELIQANTALAQARVSVERTRGLLGASRELLLYYVGIPAEQLRIRDTSPPPPNSVTLTDYLAKVGERPDLLASIESERAARAQLSAAKGEHWPTVSFDGNYYLYDSDEIQGGQWSAFITVEVPIFEGGSIEARVDENKALFAKSRLDMSQLQREAVRDVRTAFNDFNATIAELARLEEAVRTAELNYRAQKGDYELGVVSSLDVLDALQSLHDVRRDLVSAQVNAHLNLIKLGVAAGTAQP